MKNYKWLPLLVFIILCACQESIGQSTNEKKPNIVFILADDMGWMDWTVNGSKYYDTPNLERLAKRGMVFKNA